MGYNYKSIREIDSETLDYLEFVTPEPVKTMKISDINKFLTMLDIHFSELDNLKESSYIQE